MRIARVVLALSSGGVAFTRPGSTGPHPILLSVKGIRMAARAGSTSGIGGTESNSATVTLDNPLQRTTRLIGRPLRVACQLFDEDDALVQTALVSSIQYGRQILLTIDE